jgi:TrmH family RNA methyltransferase
LPAHTHPLVREYLDVKRGRVDDGDDRIAIEGLWALTRAVDAGVAVDVVFVCDALVRTDDVPPTSAVVRVSERTMHRMVDRDGPDGFAAIGRMRQHALRDVVVGGDTRIVVADALDRPGNLGTLIRGADGAGASAVIQTDPRIRRTHPLVVKASTGTVFSMPVIDATRADATAWLREHGVRIVAADPHAATTYRDADLSGPIAIVVGSERHGLHPTWRADAEVLVSIPMLGVADSLNVGHAAALLLYESALPRTRVIQAGSSSRISEAHSVRRWPADG